MLRNIALMQVVLLDKNSKILLLGVLSGLFLAGTRLQAQETSDTLTIMTMSVDPALNAFEESVTVKEHQPFLVFTTYTAQRLATESMNLSLEVTREDSTVLPAGDLPDDGLRKTLTVTTGTTTQSFLQLGFAPDLDENADYQYRYCAANGTCSSTLTVSYLTAEAPTTDVTAISPRWKDVLSDQSVITGDCFIGSNVETVANLTQENNTVRFGRIARVDNMLPPRGGVSGLMYSFGFLEDDFSDGTYGEIASGSFDASKQELALSAKWWWTNGSDSAEPTCSGSYTRTLTPLPATVPETATTPSAPLDVQVQVPEEPFRVVTWSVPDNDGGAPITAYRIYWRKTDEQQEQSEVVFTNIHSFLIEIDPDAGYVFAVTAWNELGEGERSAAVSPPASPISLTATPGNEGVGLEWAPPGDIGGSAITHYQYRQRAGSEDFGQWINIPDSDDADSNAGNETRSTVTSLTNGIAYTFQVRAVNVAGAGEATDEVTTIAGEVGICDRTPQVQEAILNALPSVTDCTVVAHINLNSLTGELDLIGKGITALKVGDFVGLATLTTLGLGANQLTSLPAGVFDDLISLTTLGLGTNQLTSLPPRIFNDLSSLTTLDLGSNQLTSLPPRVFDDLSSLTELDLGSNQLTSLPPRIFDDLSSLTELDLGSNQLSSLPASVFDDLGFLIMLDLGSNQLSSLPAGVFDDLGFLIMLGLGSNQLSSLPVGIFDDLGSLRTLFLDRNKLSSLPAGIFDSLSSLEILILNVNALTEMGLPDSIFERLTSLIIISFFSNPGSDSFVPSADAGSNRTVDVGEVVMLDATATDAGPFGSNVSFAWLQDESDSVSVTLTATATVMPTFTVPAGTPDGTMFRFDLEVIGGNKFGTLDDSFRQGLTDRDSVRVTVRIPPGAPTSLTATPGNGQVELGWVPGDVGGSAITHYQYRQRAAGEGFGAWTNISDSDDAGSNAGNETRSIVTSLTNGVAYTFQVRAVNAAGAGEATNRVTAIAGTGFGICARTPVVQGRILRRLSSRTDCAAVTEADLNSLAGELDLSERRITGLRVGDFNDLGSLTTLDLQDNQLSSLPAGIFDDLGSLITLDLEFNQLSSLPAGVFDSLNSLETLNLRVNALRKAGLPDDIFDNLGSLTELDFGFNQLSSLPVDIFDFLSSLKTLKLNSNRLTERGLPDGIFDNLGSLTTLDLGFNRFPSLPASIFDDLAALTTLDLAANQLSSLPEDIFDDLDSLTTLDLEDNRLSSLPAGIFDDLSSLRMLFLTRNGLSSLPDGIFERLTSLEEITLGRNPGSDSFIPSADAGFDRLAGAGEVVMLDATATDGGPFGSNLSFAWSQNESDSTPVTLTGADTATPTFTVPADVPDGTVFRFNLTVTGGNKFGTLNDSSRRNLTDRDSVRVTVMTPPGALTSLTATPGNGQVELEWVPGGAGGSAITRYEYRQRSAGEDFGAWINIPDGDDVDSAADNETYFTITGLTNGIAYTFQVRAVNAAGAGAALSTVSVTLPKIGQEASDIAVLTASSNLALDTRDITVSEHQPFLVFTTYTTQRPSTESMNLSLEVTREDSTVLSAGDLPDDGLRKTLLVTTGTTTQSFLQLGFAPDLDENADYQYRYCAANGTCSSTLTVSYLTAEAPTTDVTAISPRWKDALSDQSVITGNCSAGLNVETVANLTQENNTVRFGDIAPADNVLPPRGGVSGLMYSFGFLNDDFSGGTYGEIASGNFDASKQELVLSAKWWWTNGSDSAEPTCSGSYTSTLTPLPTTVPETATTPSAPLNLQVQVFEEFPGVLITWSAPDDGGAPITDYRVYWRRTDEQQEQSKTVFPSNNQYFLAGIDPDADYAFAVTAWNELGEGERSTIDTLTIMTTSVDPALNAFEESVTVKEHQPFLVFTTYTAQRLATESMNLSLEVTREDSTVLPAGDLPDDGLRKTLTVTTGTTTQSFLQLGFAPDLDENADYQYRYCAASGTCSSTLTVSYLTAEAPTTDVTAISPRWKDVLSDQSVITGDCFIGSNVETVANLTQENNTVRFGRIARVDNMLPPRGGVSGLMYSFGFLADDFSDGTYGEIASGSFDASKQELALSAKWWWTNGSDSAEPTCSGSYTRTLTPLPATVPETATTPSAPLDVQVQVPEEPFRVVTWSVPDNDGGAPITAYRIYWRKTDEQQEQSEVVFTNIHSFLIEIDPDAGYVFAVTAWNELGEGERSAAVSPPASPISLTATPGNEEVGLEWAPPGDIGGSAITHYQYRQRAGSEDFGQWINIPDSDDADSNAGNETRSTVTSLTNGIAYTFQVRAVNVAGAGEATDEVTTIAGEVGICDRTPQVQEAILNALPSVTDCTVVAHINLNSLTGELDLIGKGITALKVGDFVGLATLTTLGLGANQLTSLPAGVFDDLISLTTLGLGANQLTSLPAGVFDDLISLTTLGLGTNQLTSLPPRIFNDLSSLTTLDLGSNQLTSLPPRVFDDLSSLTELDLGSNQLTSLPPRIFDDLSSLTELDLGSNQLSSLPASVFDDLGFLIMLDLGSNQLSSLPAGVFDDLGFLIMLGLGSNQLSSLPVGIFDDLGSLRTLFLDRNKLSSLPAGIFDSLSSLEILILNVNALTEMGLPDSIFERLTSLIIISFFSNPGSDSFVPSADAGSDRTVDVGEVVMLDATATDAGPFGSNVSFAWLQDESDSVSVTLTATATVMPTFTVPAGTPDGTMFRFDLEVIGGNKFGTLDDSFRQGLTDRDSVRVTVRIPPGAPTSLTATPGNGQVELGWVPGDVGGSAITHYQYRQRAAGEGFGAWTNISDSDDAGSNAGNETRSIVTSLTNGVAYTFQVRAVNAAGAGEATNRVTAIAGTGFGICARTPVVQGRILRRLSSRTDCAAVTEADLNSLAGELDLSERRITGLRVGDFNDLGSLTTLDLQDNQLSSLPAGIFDDLGSLITLDLEFNQLSSLPAGVFDSLNSLETLNLRVNALRKAGLPDDIFDNLGSLTELDFGFNQLSSLPVDIFDFLSSLKTLKLNSNRLTERGLPDGIFDNLGSLTTLDLGFNQLSNLPAGVFDNLVSLATLDLGFNQLSSLPDGIFDNLGFLKTLDLANTQLSSLSDGIFNNLGSLETLFLGFNQLSSLPDGIFNNLNSLTVLDLGGNQLSNLPAGVFDDLGSLTGLYLDRNELSSLPAGVFDFLSSLERLILNVNALTETGLPDGIFERLISLRVISLLNSPGTDSFIPSADAGFDRTAAASEVVMLDATATDGGPFGSNLSFAWSQNESDSTPVTLTGADTATPTFTVPADVPDGTVFRFNLTVVGGNKFRTLDGSSRRRLTDRDSMKVTAGIPPGVPQNVMLEAGDTTVTVTWAASDLATGSAPDTYRVRWLSENQQIGTATVAAISYQVYGFARHVGSVGPGFNVDEFDPGGLASHGGQLYLIGLSGFYTLDPETGVTVRIGSGRFNIGVGGFDPGGLVSHNGTLYMVGTDGETRLYTLDPGTGTAEQVGAADQFNVGESDPNGLASHNGMLYMVGARNDALYTLNPETGIASQVGPAGFNVGESSPGGLASHNGVLYMVGSNGDALYTLNPRTGIASQVGAADQFNIGESVPSGLTSHNGILYMVGADADTLYQLHSESGRYTIEDLTNDTEYTIEVAAVINAVAATTAAAVTVTPTVPQPPPLPSTPQNVMLEAGNKTITVTWVASDLATGGAPDTYRVRWLSEGQQIGTATTAAISYRIYGFARQVGNVGPGFNVVEFEPTGLASHGDQLYMVGRQREALFTLDPGTGIADQVGPRRFDVGERFPTGLALHNGTLYMLGSNPPSDPSLYTLDPETGIASLVVSVGISYAGGLASHGDQLYMVGGIDLGNPALYTLDPKTGAADQVGTADQFNVNENLPSGLVSHDGTLYMVGAAEYMAGDADRAALYTLDPETGVAEQVGAADRFNVGEGTPSGLASHNGILYMVGSDTDTLYRLHSQSGRYTIMGLINGTEYTIEVAAVNAAGATTAAAVTTTPNVPTFTVSFDPSEYTVSEGAGGDSSGELTLTLKLISAGRPPRGDVTVTVSTRDGSALAVEDYDPPLNNEEVVFSSAAGVTESSQTISIRIVNNIVQEHGDELFDHESFSVVITDVTAAHSDDTVVIGQGEATVAIVNDDPSPIWSLDMLPSTVGEGMDTVVPIVMRRMHHIDRGHPLTLELGGTATFGEDYVITDMQDNPFALPLTFTAPHIVVPDPTYRARLMIMDDLVFEGVETIEIRLTTTHPSVFTDDTSQTITITDNDADAAPVFTSSESFEINEGQTLVGTVAAADANPQDEVTYSVTGGADQDQFTIDSSSGELIFTTAPDYENPADADGDNVYMLTVAASGGTSARALTTTQAITVMVLDVATTITVTAEEPAVTEGEPTVFVFERTDSTDALDLLVNVTVVATDDEMLADAAPSRVTFAAGSATTVLSLATVIDEMIGDRTVMVTVNDGMGYEVGIENSAEVRVINVNVAPVFTSSESFEVNEGQTVVGTVTAADANPQDEVTYSVTGGADEALFTFADSSSGELIFTTAPDYENPADADTDNVYMLIVTAAGGTDARALTTTQAITVTVLDVATTITIAAAEPAVTEGEPAVFVFERTDSTDALALAVNITVDDPDGVLAAAAPEMVTFAAGSATAELSLATDDDTLEEDDSVVTVTIIDGADYRIGIENSTSVRVVDDDVNVAPAFISAASFEVNEGQTVVGTVTAADANIEDEVMYSVTGDGVDDALFAINSSSGELSFVTAPDFENPVDTDEDNNYMLTVTASGGTDARALTTTQAITVAVLDVATTITIMAAEPVVMEGEPAVFTFSRTDATEAPVLAVNITVDDPDGVLAAAAPEMVTFAAGSATAALSLATDDDTLEEDDSTVTVTVVATTDYEVGIENSAEVRVVDNDVNVAPVFTSSASFDVNEGETVVGTVTAEDANIEDEVTYSVTGGADQDQFTIDLSSGELSFATVPDYENPADADTDNVYMLIVTAIGGTDARALTTTQVITVTVLDVPTTITIAAAEPAVTEGEPAVFVFERTDSTEAPVLAVNIIVDDPDGVLAAAAPSRVTFAAGSATTVLSLATVIDEMIGDRTVMVTVNDGMGYEVGIENSASVRVVDDDVNVAPAFTSAASFDVNEGETVVGTVTAEDANPQDEVTYSVTGGADGTLFTIDPSSGELSFATAPDYENPADADTDNVYMLIVTAAGGTDARALTTTQAITVTVLDVATTITITADDAEVTEGEQAMFTLERTDATDAPVLAVNITVDDPGGVLAAAAPEMVTFNAGSATAELSLATDDDTLDEADSVVTVTIIDGVGYRIGIENSASVRVVDNDVNVAPVFSDPVSFEVNEGQTVVGTVTAADANPQDEATYSVTGGADEALFTIDSSSGELIFTTAPDYENPTDADGDNAYMLTVAAIGGTNVRALTTTQAITVTVLDVPTTITITADKAEVTEGEPATFTLERTDATDAPVLAVNITVDDPDGVLAAAAPGMMTFDADSATAMLNLATIDDTLEEDDSVVTVTIIDGADYRIGIENSASVRVVDDDVNVAPAFSDPVSFEVDEGQTVVGTVTAEDANMGDEVTYSVTGGADGTLFTIDPSSGELSFATAPDYENPVDADTDNVYMLIVTAIGGTGVRALTTTQAITVMVLDVATTITVTAEEPAVTEGEPAVFVFERTDSTDALALTVNITVDDPGGVLADAAPGMVTFDAGSATAVLSLATIDDTLEEADSVVTVTIIDGVGYRIGIENSASVRVVDDDVNVAPAFTSAASFDVNEGETVVGTVTAEDANPQDEVTYSVTGGADGTLFTIDPSSGELSFAAAPDFENPTDADGDNAYMLTVAAIGGTNVRALTTTQAITVTVLDVPTTITITADKAEVTEGEPATFTLERTDSMDASTLTVNITVDDPDGVLAAAAPEMVTFAAGSATAELSLATDDDMLEEDDSVVTVTVIGGAGYRIGIENSASVRVVDDDVNVAPAFTSAASFDVNEGETVVGTVTAEDANPQDEVTYSVTGGADDALFDIDSSLGELIFTTAPDYENPTDADTDNVYMLIVTVAGGTDARALTTTQAITVTVLDVATTITITADDAEVTEGKPVMFTFERTDSTDAPALTVNITVDDPGGVLADAAPGMVTFAVGSARTVLSLATIDEMIGDRTVMVTVNDGMGYEVGIENSAEVRVIDVNVAPVFSDAVSFDVNEGETVVGTVTAEDANIEDEVTYSITGGTDGALFTIDPSSGELSFATAPDYENPADADTDNVYMLIVTAAGGTDARALTTTQAITVTVLDVATTITITADDAEVTEGEQAMFTLERTDSTDALALTVNITVVATDDEVLADAAPGMVTFDAGSARTVLSLATIDDTLEEDDSTVTVTVVDSTDYEVGIENSASVRVVDDDVNVAPAFTSAASFDVNEGETVVGTVTAEDANPQDEVTYSVTGDGADDALFAIDSSSGELSFATVPDYENPADADTDNVYMLIVTAAGGTDARALTTTQAITVTVLDVATTITIAADDAEVTEGEPVMFTFERTDSTDALALTVNIMVDDPDGVLADAAPGMVTFDAGSARTVLSLATIDDTLEEDDSVVTVTIIDGAGYRIGIENSASVHVVDDDVNVAPAFTSAASFDVNEGETVVGTVTAEDANPQDEVTYSVTGGAGTLFTIDSSSGELSFATAPDYENPADADTDNVYMLIVTVAGGTDARALTTTQAITVTVLDVATTITITADDAEVTEGEPVMFTFERTDSTDAPTLTVNITIDATDEVLADAAPGMVTFDAGSARTVLSLATIDDTLEEDDSTVTVTVVATTDYEVGIESSAEVRVVDNDAVPGAPMNLTAGAGNTRVALSWEAPADPGTAPIERYEYRASNDAGTIGDQEWNAAGDATGEVRTQIVSSLSNDTEYTFEVRAVSAAGNGAAAQIMATPSSETAVFTLTFDPSEYTFTESAERVTLTLRLIGEGRALQDDVTVTVSTRDGSAVTPQDYVAIENATVVFEPEEGVTELTQTVTIQIVNDIVFELDDEIFSVVINDVTAAASSDTVVIDQDEATVTIVDDGGTPIWVLDRLPSSVGESTGTVSIEMENMNVHPVSRGYSLTLELGGTATFGGDYVITDIDGNPLASPPTFDVAQDQTMLEARLIITDDRVFEGEETIEIRLSTTEPKILIDDATTQTITLIDNDAAPVLFLSVSTTAIDEGESIDITLEITNESVFAEDQTIALEFTGDAMPGDDYTVSVDGSPLLPPYELTLTAGESALSVTIMALIDDMTTDMATEADEAIEITALHGADTIGKKTLTIISDVSPVERIADLTPAVLGNFTPGAVIPSEIGRYIVIPGQRNDGASIDATALLVRFNPSLRACIVNDSVASEPSYQFDCDVLSGPLAEDSTVQAPVFGSVLYWADVRDDKGLIVRATSQKIYVAPLLGFASGLQAIASDTASADVLLLTSDDADVPSSINLDFEAGVSPSVPFEDGRGTVSINALSAGDILRLTAINGVAFSGADSDLNAVTEAMLAMHELFALGNNALRLIEAKEAGINPIESVDPGLSAELIVFDQVTTITLTNDYMVDVFVYSTATAMFELAGMSEDAVRELIIDLSDNELKAIDREGEEWVISLEDADFSPYIFQVMMSTNQEVTASIHALGDVADELGMIDADLTLATTGTLLTGFYAYKQADEASVGVARITSNAILNLPPLPDGREVAEVESGVFDFIAADLTGGVATVVVELSAAAQEGSRYYKYQPDDGWTEFNTSSNDRIYSAPAPCPSAQASREPDAGGGLSDYAWRLVSDGVRADDECLLLEIEDGSVNDSDGRVNGIIFDPGALVQFVARVGGGGGGAVGLWWLLLFVGIILAAMVLKRRNARPTRRISP